MAAAVLISSSSAIFPGVRIFSQKEKKSKSIESSNKPPYDDVDYQEFDDNYLQEYYDEQDVVPEYGNYIKPGQNHFYYVIGKRTAGNNMFGRII